MIDIIRGDERGSSTLDWLDSKHTFSFADYHNPARVRFGSLRVVNEDWIDAGKGFGTHPHRDMEIVTYMLDGELSHKDSMGNGSVIQPGELQRMTAGTGVMHSEFNTSNSATAHLLQIWILPERKGLPPGYEQKAFPADAMRNQWRLIGSRDGRDGSLTIHQDVNLFEAELGESQSLEVSLQENRLAFLQLVRGSVTIDGKELVTGDAVTIQDQRNVALRAAEDSRLLLFDMG